MDVAKAAMPGSAPTTVGMCMAGLPTVATFRWSMRLSMMASRPKKVKNSEASMPSILAPLAMMSAG